eukprot:5141085-Prymnesium_polylepis.1
MGRLLLAPSDRQIPLSGQCRSCALPTAHPLIGVFPPLGRSPQVRLPGRPGDRCQLHRVPVRCRPREQPVLR